MARGERWDASVTGTLRFQEAPGNLYDRRIGGEFDFHLGSGVSIRTGYVLRGRDVEDLGSVREQRWIAGLAYPIVARSFVIEGATYYERHVVADGLVNFNRYRQRFEVDQPEKSISPWLYQDFTFLNEGFARSRSRFGVKWRSRAGYSLKVAYQFESIQKGPAWRPRHAIYTSLSIDKPLWSSPR